MTPLEETLEALAIHNGKVRYVLLELFRLAHHEGARRRMGRLGRERFVSQQIYASPFYGESSFTMYRTDLMDKARLKMPEKPTWDFIRQAADKMTDKTNGTMACAFVASPDGAKTRRS